jgi:hypothetical protein
MVYIKCVLLIFLLFGNLYSQISFNITKIIDLPSEFSQNDFQPNRFSVSQTGLYFLDTENRQVAFLSNDGVVAFAGGYGLDNDAFIDPIEILSTRLRVIVIDRTENKLIEFDHKLNYLRTIEFDPTYPEFGGIDDWGNVLLQSDQEQKIFIGNSLLENFEEFIDLSIYKNISSCISDVYVASNGSIGILSNCNKSVQIFNRLGNLENKYQLENSKGISLIQIQNEWLLLDGHNQIISIRNKDKVTLSIDFDILDVVELDGSLYILSSNQIWVVDVSME